MEPTERERLIKQIVAVRKERDLRIAELAQVPAILPPGCYVGTYKSNYRYTYRTLGNKNAVFPRDAGKEGLRSKIHLGRDFNPRYGQAILMVEAARMREIKVDALQHLRTHLKSLYALLKSQRLLSGTKWDRAQQMKEFQESLQKESIFAYIVRQNQIG